MDWQDIVLLIVLAMNGVIAVQAMRIYNTQSRRIEELNKYVEELKNFKFGNLNELTNPVKEYIDLINEVRKNEKDLLHKPGTLDTLKNIEAILMENRDNLDIILRSRLSSCESFSRATKYADQS